jgi:predicted CXXCH cytochrome family protein
MKLHLMPLLVLLALAYPQWTAAAEASARPSRGPLPTTMTPVSSHAPFESGDCNLCHATSDPKQPGPVVKTGVDMCLGCHEEFADVLKRPHVHPPASKAASAATTPTIR